MLNQPVLYNYFRSSTSVRVRIGLNFKGIDYKYVSLHLRKKEHQTEEYLKINPYGLLPAIEFPSGIKLNQSLAILEYLDEKLIEFYLIPLERAKVRSMAYAIALEIHPLNNLHVLNYLKDDLNLDDVGVKNWFSKWVHKAFTPFESILQNDKDTGLYCFGNTPTLVDICLFAQVVNNARFEVDMTRYPKINSVYKACLNNKAFYDALPKNQPDAE